MTHYAHKDKKIILWELYIKSHRQSNKKQRIKQVQLYQFEKIYKDMEKEFGKIKSGDEEAHTMMFLPIEGNALKIHRKYPSSNSRRLREAIALALFKIKGYCTDTSYDTNKFRDENNKLLEYALLMAFDPFTNPEIKEIIESENKLDLNNPTELHNYYKEPVMCLLRIKESVDTWEKRNGSDGYFNFIEGYMGHEIKGDDLNYSIQMPLE